MRLVTKGFKGRDAAIEIKGAKIVVGPTASGKTAIADALRFLAMGFVPYLGKRPQDTAALLRDGDRELSVELVADTGSAKRTLIRHDKGYSVDASASWLIQAKPSEQAKGVSSLFGKEEVDIAEILDLRELLNATPNTRAARLEALVASGKRTADETLVAVKRKIVQRLADVDDGRMAAIKDYKDLLPLVPVKCLEVLNDSADALAAKIRDAGIPGALAWANEGKKTSADGVRRREQARKELSLRAAEIAEPDEKELKALDAAVAELDRKVGSLENQSKGASAAIQRRRAALDALQELARVVAAAETSAADQKALTEPRVAAIDREVAELGDEPAMPAAAPRPKAADELTAKADALTKEADAIAAVDVPTTAPARMAVERLKDELQASKASPWIRILELAREIDAALPRTNKKARPYVAELREIAKAEKGEERDPAAVQSDLVMAEKALRKAEQDVRDAEAQGEEADRKRAALREKARVALLEARQIADKAEEGRRATLGDWSDRSGRWGRRRAELRAEREALLQAHKAALDSMFRAKVRHSETLKIVDALGPEPDAVQDPAPLRQDREDKAAKVRGMRAAAAVFAEIQRTLEEIEAARALMDTYTAIEWALQQERQAELAHAGGRFLEIVTRFLKAGERAEVPFIKPGAVVGWTREPGTDWAHDVVVQTMSGAEWALFVAAMTSAALILRDGKLKILLVEADAMDPSTFRSLCLGIQEILPELTGAIVTTWRSPAEKLKDFEIVDMTPTLSSAQR